MRSLVLSALLATPFAASAVAPAEIQAPVLVTRIDCHVVIGKDGRVADYQPRTELAAPVADRVRDMVKALRFEPVEVDGRVVEAETDMRVAVTAVALGGGGLQLALDNVSFPKANLPPAAMKPIGGGRGVHVRFPTEALYTGASADLLAVLRFGPDGRVVDAAIEQSALLRSKAPPAEAARTLSLFEKSTLQMLRKWKVDPALMPADSRVGDGYVSYVPVSYRIDAPETKPGDWTLETRTARRVPAWMTVVDRAPQPGVADLAEGEMAGVNTRFRLAVPLGAAGS